MSRKVIAASVSSFLFAAVMSTAGVALSQPVSVNLSGGVHVRAPFVSVDVYPGGGVSVRAPFTAVDVGGRSYVVGRPVVVEPSLPTPQALAAMDDEAVWRSLRNASLRLNQRLSRFDTGATWQRYLRLPDELVSGSAADADQRRAAAAELQERFGEVAANARYRKIADLPAFAAMQAVLTEMVSRPPGASSASGASAEELPPPARGREPNERSFLTPAK
jgi:hypothetical protein